MDILRLFQQLQFLFKQFSLLPVIMSSVIRKKLIYEQLKTNRRVRES